MENNPDQKKPETVAVQEKENYKLQKKIGSKTFLIFAMLIIEIILLIGAFDLGMKVAFRKARYTYSWQNHYPENFSWGAGSHIIFGRPPKDEEFFNAFSAVGQVVGVKDNSITIKAADGNEKIIIFQNDTAIKKGFANISEKDIKAGDQIVVIGEADDNGQIEAKLIRILNP